MRSKRRDFCRKTDQGRWLRPYVCDSAEDDTKMMTTRNLSRRLERLETRAPTVDRLRSVRVNFVGADGSVSNSLLFEPGKPPKNIPASAATSEAPQRLKARRW